MPPRITPFEVKEEHKLSHTIAQDIVDLMLDDVYNLAKYNKGHNKAPSHAKRYTIMNIRNATVNQFTSNQMHRKRADADKDELIVEPEKP